MYIGMKTSEDIILSSGEFVGFPSECLMIEFFIFSFNLTRFAKYLPAVLLW